jgi:hypothetical protein
MKLRTIKLALSWILLAICAFGVAAVFMQLPWPYLLATLVAFLFFWALLAIVEWKQWFQMSQSLRKEPQ